MLLFPVPCHRANPHEHWSEPMFWTVPNTSPGTA